MPELVAILVAKRKNDFEDKKFLAALQGVNLDDSEKDERRGQQEWEDLKARVFSGGQAKTSDDIVSLQGANAQMAGFGIGMGIEYVKQNPKNPMD